MLARRHDVGRWERRARLAPRRRRAGRAQPEWAAPPALEPVGGPIRGLVVGLTLTGAFWLAVALVAALLFDLAGIAPL